MRSKIQKSVNSKGEDKNFINSVLFIMWEFKYTYEEVIRLPIPVYLELVKYCQEIIKQRRKNGNRK